MMFSKISYGLNLFASKLMGMSSGAQNKIAWYIEESGNDVISGNNSVGKTIWIMIRSSIMSMLETSYEMIIRLIYAIGKWILTIIDFIFIFIRQIIGLNAEYSSIEELSRSDMIFQFIFNENVVRIVRNLLLFSIVLLILFSIIAIIMSEYKYATQGGDNSKKGILVSSLKSLFLMAFIPVVVIGSILMSNAVLRALYIATAGGQDTSLSSQIFVASTYQSNAYRRYARNNQKIPITYNFSEISDTDNVSGYGTSGGVQDLESALESFKNDSVWLRGFKTFLMFETESFLDMSAVDELELLYKSMGKTSPYNAVYDSGIESRAEQYYVMGDVLDWAIKGQNTFYFKTAEEIYKSYDDALTVLGNSEDIPSYMPIVKSGDDYTFDVWYEGDLTPVTYIHKGGATDESKGAKFLIAVEKIAVKGTKVKSYYYPLLSANESFATDYYEKANQVVVAKGLFQEGDLPTAIRVEDGVVNFYRDDLNIPSLVDIFPHISYEMPPQGATEEIGLKLIKAGFKFITGVDINQFIPYVYFNVDIFNLFTKTSNSIVKLANGEMHLNYNFTQRGYSMNNLYKISSFNVFIFFAASMLLLGVLIKILFGVIFRVLDITTLYITYPAVLAAIPLDGGSRFKGWTDSFVKKVLSVYGVIVGINLVLLLSPIVYSIKIFSPQDIKHALQFKYLPTGMISVIGADFVNFIFQFLFVFAAFASIEKFSKVIEGLATNWQPSDDDKDMETSKKLGGIVTEGEQVVNDLKALPEKIANITSGQALMDIAEKGIGFVKGFIPGSAIAGAISDYKKDKAKKEAINQKIEDLKNKAKAGPGSGSSSKDSGSSGGGEGGSSDAASTESSNEADSGAETGGNQTPPNGSDGAPDGGTPELDSSSTEADGSSEAVTDSGDVSAEDAGAPETETPPESDDMPVDDSSTEADSSSESPSEEPSTSDSEGSSESHSDDSTETENSSSSEEPHSEDSPTDDVSEDSTTGNDSSTETQTDSPAVTSSESSTEPTAAPESPKGSVTTPETNSNDDDYNMLSPVFMAAGSSAMGYNLAELKSKSMDYYIEATQDKYKEYLAGREDNAENRSAYYSQELKDLIAGKNKTFGDINLEATKKAMADIDRRDLEEAKRRVASRETVQNVERGVDGAVSVPGSNSTETGILEAPGTDASAVTEAPKSLSEQYEKPSHQVGEYEFGADNLANAYADLNQEDYKKYLNGQEDTAEMRSNFHRDQVSSEDFIEKETQAVKLSDYRRDNVTLAGSGALPHLRNEIVYADRDKEGYKKFLNGRQDTDTERFKYYNSQAATGGDEFKAKDEAVRNEVNKEIGSIKERETQAAVDRIMSKARDDKGKREGYTYGEETAYNQALAAATGGKKGVKSCPKCGASNTANANFCTQCGTRL